MSARQARRPLSILFLVLLLCAPGIAAAAEWKIVQISGDVRIFHQNVTWVSLSTDRELKPGDAIWTGHNGRVLLVSSDGRVILKPRSMIKIPAQSLPDSYNVLFQSMGELEADVEKRNKKHFSIITPFLAAVVKGTKFSITVSDEESVLRVSEGIVEATDRRSGQKVNVLAGQYVASLHGVAGKMIGNAQGAEPDASTEGSPDSSGSTGNDSPGPAGNAASTGRTAGTVSSGVQSSIGVSGGSTIRNRCVGNCGNGVGNGSGNGTGNEGVGFGQ